MMTDALHFLLLFATCNYDYGVCGLAWPYDVRVLMAGDIDAF